jgi:hypothetical protein
MEKGKVGGRESRSVMETYNIMNVPCPVPCPGPQRSSRTLWQGGKEEIGKGASIEEEQVNLVNNGPPTAT